VQEATAEIDKVFTALRPRVRGLPSDDGLEVLQSELLCSYTRMDLIMWLTDHQLPIPTFVPMFRLRRLVGRYLLQRDW
jgi:hypothetical protein